VSPEQLLGQLEGQGRMVVADLEAGVGTLTRLSAESLDVLVVIAEPTAKSIDVARRAAAVAGERGLGPIRHVANKVRSPDDIAWLRETLGPDLVAVSEDPAIAAADRHGHAPLDVAPDAPAILSLVAFARELGRASKWQPEQLG
jgi:CO dehydrogenase maturation factor